MNPRAPELCRSRRHAAVGNLLSDLREDIGLYARRSFEAGTARGLLGSLSALLTPSLGAVVLHRLAHCLHARGAFRAAAALSLANVLIHKTAITPVSCIDAGLFLPHPVGLVFHGCAGKRLTLYANVVCAELGAVGTGPVESGPCLGNDVVVGVHAAVLGSVQVGDGIRIGFGSVLREDAGEAGVIASGRSRVRIETRL